MSTYHFTPNKASKASKGTIPIVSKQNPSHNTKREIAKLYIEISAIENKLATLKNKAESLKAQIQTDEFMNDVLATESSLMQSIYDVFKGRDDIIHLQPNGPDGIWTAWMIMTSRLLSLIRKNPYISIIILVKHASMIAKEFRIAPSIIQ